MVGCGVVLGRGKKTFDERQRLEARGGWGESSERTVILYVNDEERMGKRSFHQITK